MNFKSNPKYYTAHNTVKNFIIILVIVSAFLAILHYYLADIKIGGVYWFNLDKERNLPTWFSGMLFFLVGCVAMAAFYWERKNNEVHNLLFKMPQLWLGVALIGFAMSLDEMTILHENLFWKDIRNVSSKLDGSMMYVTQWQVLYAPVIVITFGYFGVFFTNRFGASRRAIISAFTGMAIWMIALLLEGTRQTFKNAGAELYSLQTLVEEYFEMFGAILLLYSIINYTIDIAFDLNDNRKEKLSRATKLLSKKGVYALGIILIVITISVTIIYNFAQEQFVQDAPIPKLFQKVLNK
jgi:MFS family permease